MKRFVLSLPLYWVLTIYANGDVYNVVSGLESRQLCSNIGHTVTGRLMASGAKAVMFTCTRQMGDRD